MDKARPGIDTDRLQAVVFRGFGGSRFIVASGWVDGAWVQGACSGALAAAGLL